MENIEEMLWGKTSLVKISMDQEIAAAKDLDAASFKMLDEFQLCEITELKPDCRSVSHICHAADSEMTVKPEETVMGVKKRKVILEFCAFLFSTSMLVFHFLTWLFWILWESVFYLF
ncbi:uncharacterized protein LOC120146731 isoform X2 [Hibiscus syriacus]|uniref:uncharacterized protein LOC120146731 isoform X2 n=1 Tax=Hibiscus syriacus TaxID=106335 RepID=UPI0019231C89|nr:uncharacterized protein LOC120146731 isoform X2 [Hibiscus syriacus]XP_039016170.1 uncharacterized protein LOC120146731 isoform X2 [Hibiscus syriacus]